MKKNDFFFGEILKSGGHFNKPFCDVIELSTQVSAFYFTTQIERVLTALEGEFILNCDTSYTEVYRLIEKLNALNIGKVELVRVKYHPPEIPFVLTCKFYLRNGVVSVRSHWCAYKEVRAEELVHTLLAPLFQYNLISKTYISYDGELESVSNDTEELIRNVLGYLSNSSDRVDVYTKHLNEICVLHAKPIGEQRG